MAGIIGMALSMVDNKTSEEMEKEAMRQAETICKVLSNKKNSKALHRAMHTSKPKIRKKNINRVFREYRKMERRGGND